MKRPYRMMVFAAALLALSGCGSAGDADEGAVAAQEDAAPPEPAEAVLAVDGEGLLEQVRVSDGEARVVALRNVAEGHIATAALKEEDGRLVYVYDVEIEGRPGTTRVRVDALTADVLPPEDVTTG